MKHILLILVLVGATCGLQAQDMKQLFIELPDSIAPLLTKINREDCVDFLESQMKAQVKNRFGKTSELKQLTADYLLLQTTEQSTLQLKLLPQNDSVSIVCAIFTACAPACDSQIKFYTTNWELLNRELYLTLPKETDFFLQVDSLDMGFSLIKNQLDMTLLRADVMVDSNDLIFTYTTPDYLSKDEREKMEPYLRTSLRYFWRGGRFHPHQE